MILTIALSVPGLAYEKYPGKGVTVNPARGNWDTGYFQEALVRAGLKELGYKVHKPKELQNTMFYASLALGDVDYWANGWFPMHNSQMPKNFDKKGSKVGYIMKSGGMQGYLISKKYADKYNIKSLADFKRPEVRKAFDANGDGKADLTGCETGWACAKTIAFHMKTYGLNNDINVIQATYNASMADAIARFKNDKPIFFYTWAPNWTIYTLKPGRDVVWINVPKIVPREMQKGAVDKMTAYDVVGAVTNPVKLGFIAADIRIVANNKFLAANPAAKKFFEDFKLKLSDVSAQNTKMRNGEKSQQDIERHAQEWIKAHQKLWNGWLEDARNAAS